MGWWSTAKDGNGNVDTSFNGPVTVYDYYGYTLGGTVTVNAVNGVATFSGLTEYTAGGHYLYATGSGVSTAYTNYFTVTAAAATHLVTFAPYGVLTSAPFYLTVYADDPSTTSIRPSTAT